MMKRYIGDGCYVEFDGKGIILTTNNGIEETNYIYIEPEVWLSLIDYVDALKKKKETS